jgi:phosphomannomutase/phosphomannomutase/phosphoglucomutase
MKEIDAPLAGEMSGHIFFKDRWYGFDDGIYGACRMLEIVAAQPQPASVLFNALPNSHSTPEIDWHFAEGEHFAFMQRILQQAHFPDAQVFTLDGLRVDFADGWGLIRPSNTTPMLVVRFDAQSPEALARITERFRTLIQQVDASITPPF